LDGCSSPGLEMSVLEACVGMELLEGELPGELNVSLEVFVGAHFALVNAVANTFWRENGKVEEEKFMLFLLLSIDGETE